MTPQTMGMTSEEKARILQDAERHVLQGRNSQAIVEYQKIVRNDPEDVLTLNIIGDLCLRLGRMREANDCFTRVAQFFSRHNFLLKAIAVYRKILSCDPENSTLYGILADLYSRQGMSREARTQYLRIAEVAEKTGNASECLDAYEKAAAIDPAHAGVQLKLANIFLGDAQQDKAHRCFLNAAAAQAKSGDTTAAFESYLRALDLKPAEFGVMSSFLEVARKAAHSETALQRLRKCAAAAPDDVDLQELLGEALLANGELEEARRTSLAVLRGDESRFGCLFAVQRRYIERGDLDAAAGCLDDIIPALINRRMTDQAEKAYNEILDRDPAHIQTLWRLAELFAATGDIERQVNACERLARQYLERDEPRLALDPIEKILRLMPESRPHADLHRRAFESAFPDVSYVPPAAIEAQVPAGIPAHDSRDIPTQAGAPGGDLVEVDLLLNYGLKGRAQEALLGMLARDPENKEARRRLITLHREAGQNLLAARQCLDLADILEKEGDPASAATLVEEARRLDAPLVAEREQRLGDRARAASAYGFPSASGGMEMDLSDDLHEFLLQPPPEAAAGSEPAMELRHSAPVSDRVTAREGASEETLGDLLHEVDFYVRLGFFGEARIRLDDAARRYPDSPEIPARLAEIVAAEAVASRPDEQRGAEKVEATAAGAVDEFEIELADEEPPELAPPSTDASIALTGIDAAAREDQETLASGVAQTEDLHSEIHANLRSDAPEQDAADEVIESPASPLPEQGAAKPSAQTREDYETHFSLGVVYRDMELLDDAIREFQCAAGSVNPEANPMESIRCCGMLSTCFLEKKAYQAALEWCERGLSVPGISTEEETALRYDAGVAYLLEDQRHQALKSFERAYSLDPSFRDVARKVGELRAEVGEG